MTTNSNAKFSERERTTGFKIVRFVLLVALAVALYFFGLGMVHNRFLQGGHLDRYGHISR
jgi:hypothetical protein